MADMPAQGGRNDPQRDLPEDPLDAREIAGLTARNFKTGLVA